MILPHARQRLSERYGLALTPAEERALVIAITMSVEAPGPAIFLGRQTDGREHYGLEVRGQWVRLVWCPDSAAVVTALTPLPRELWRVARKGRFVLRRAR